jgi:predicted methyltransferase
MIHWRTHPEPVDGCFACKIMSVSVSADAIPTRRPRAAEVNATERRWNVDMDAYKRIVRSGGQPNQIDGSARMEAHADNPYELAQMKVFDVQNKEARFKRADQVCQDMGIKTLTENQ